MDLRSMLNDSQSQKAQVAPRISSSSHTPHSSYDGRIEHTPGSDDSSARPTSYGPPLNTGDPRAQGLGGASYFTMQSPHPNTSASASTLSAGPQSAYAQSPGSHAGVYTPRSSRPPSNAPTHNTAFVSPSPSVSVHHPPTPGSASGHNQSYHSQHAYTHHHNSYPPTYQQFQSPPPPQANGLPPSHTRQISPSHPYPSQPATPLGPPISYTKQSPHSGRPSSQGNHDHHLRGNSVGSVSSIRSRDYNHYSQPLPIEHTREGIPRPSPYDTRERSRSESVSPKTIPRPIERGSQTSFGGTPSVPLQPQTYPTMSHQNSLDRQVEPSQPPLRSSSTSMSSMHDHQTLTDQVTRQSPAPLPVVAPREPSPLIDTQSSLKRSASHLSDNKPPPQKRPRGVIPRWAQSARGNRPLRFVDTPQHNSRPKQQIQQRPPPLPQNETAVPPRQNSNTVLPQHVPPQAQGQGWESSIANVVPFENLTRKVCDWIISIIAVRPAPVGSTWEIEAKVGTIRNRQGGERYSNPDVDSEVLLREGTRNTRFESSMNEDQHRALNVYLNGLTEAALKARLQDPSRIEILYNHPKENDEFYELSSEGKARLNADLQGWINDAAGRGHRREVRVRRTTNKVTGEVTAQIIKTRVADKEIYNPDFDFDFRISISLETRWEGQKEHLTQMADNRGRNKDRVSYRHMIYQIDLTQVTYDGSDRKDHELEVEVATESLKQEIEKLRRNDPNNQVERMVTGLVDNVRLLCRKGSVG